MATKLVRLALLSEMVSCLAGRRMPRETPRRKSLVGRKVKMTDTAKVTVSFSQKVSEAPYETADYSLSIERVVPESMGDDGILAEASSMFEQVKSEVLKQAGQEIDLTPDGVVMRRLKSGVSRASNNQASTTTPSPGGSA